MSINYEEIAKKHQISVSAVQHLAQAIARGNGTQAQFNHPEIGGMGQWMPSMMMIGDAFNYTLKAKIDALCHDLAQAYHDGDIKSISSIPSMQVKKWWSSEHHNPTFSGGQNNIRYAYFVSQHRLVIQQDSKELTYDTSPHILSGVSQQQTNTIKNLAFHTQGGQTVTVEDFKLVT